MNRARVKSFGALLALAALLALHLHVLAHVFGLDKDGDQDGKAPCAVCQAVLAQHALQAVASVDAPGSPGKLLEIPFAPLPGFPSPDSVDASTRGPPWS